jgi:hypothetical protein
VFPQGSQCVDFVGNIQGKRRFARESRQLGLEGR